jgi:hypothetical protein
MTTRTYTQKNGTIWEWDETPELVKILEQIHTNNNTSNTGSDNTVV